MAITHMPQYQNHPFEELRVQDYEAGRKKAQPDAFEFGAAVGWVGAPAAAPAFGGGVSSTCSEKQNSREGQEILEGCEDKEQKGKSEEIVMEAGGDIFIHMYVCVFVCIYTHMCVYIYMYMEHVCM